jgi:hypothetical protein
MRKARMTTTSKQRGLSPEEYILSLVDKDISEDTCQADPRADASGKLGKAEPARNRSGVR